MKDASRDRGVVHQPGADSRQVGADLDAERAQIARRADAGAQQMRRRVDRAGAEDHLAGAEFDLPPADRGAHADAGGAVEQQRA